MYKVFIDGAHGTTGLRINEYLAKRTDIEVLEIDPEKRKDTEERINMIKKDCKITVGVNVPSKMFLKVHQIAGNFVASQIPMMMVKTIAK